MLNILLVGEGNFSFSASLCDSNQETYLIVATCYETEDAISKQPISSVNVKHLRSKGALVHFEVDATRLKEYAFLTAHHYDRIIFNFPHCGRKAGVKKNRDLLCSFFHSCVEILAQEGEVHVALCQGQGGTPADHPRREWHNSWQIVTMAAKAGFILSAVTPFASDQYDGYQNTGYRSQEKSFHMAGSLNHIFTRSLPQENMRALQLIERLTNSPAFLQDSDYSSSEALRASTGRESYHPISLLYEELIRHIQNDLPINILPDSFPTICDASVLSSVPQWPEFCKNGTDQVEIRKWTLVEDSSTANNRTDNSNRQNGLTPTWTSFIKHLVLRYSIMPGTLNVLCGPVIRRCLISPWLMPVYHELLLLLCCSNDSLTSQLQLLIETIQNAVVSVVKSIFSYVNNELGSVNLPLNASYLTFHHHVDFTYFINTFVSESDKRIGIIKVVPPGEISSDFYFILTALNLDLMTMCFLGIEDWRLLWTADQRFTQQFHQCQLKRFKNFSLYPPSYTHDISFWVGEGLGFDEIEFHTIARRVSNGNIINIELLEQYEDGKTGKTSLCYRLTYRSCDCALSYESALEMQLKLRNEVQRCLHITLR